MPAHQFAAKHWANAESLVEKTYKEESLNNVPDDGLLVQTILGRAVNTFRASPNGLVPDDPIEHCRSSTSARR